MGFGSLVSIAISAILVNNFVLSRFLGICPFIGVSKDTESALGMGMAVTFVMTLASIATWTINRFLLVALGITYLQTVTFILVIAALVQLVEMIVQKTSPTLYQALGIYLPLITTNCAILGVALLNEQEGYSLVESTVHGFAAGIGFSLALLLMAGLRERINYADIPQPLRGIPIAFITATLLSLAFFGFSGL